MHILPISIACLTLFSLPAISLADCIKGRLSGGRVRLSIVDTDTCRTGQIAVPSGRVIAKTVIPISGEADLSTIDGTFHEISGTSGTVTKQEEDSTLRVSLNGNAELMNDGDATAFCTFQVRVNGNDSTGAPSSVVTTGVTATATMGSGNIPSSAVLVSGASATGHFDNIAAGTTRSHFGATV